MNKLKVYLEMIKFQHSIFALPFAYLGAFLAEMRVPDLLTLFWITLAMVGARSFAMALNRLIDTKIDRLNPRTADRALPKGLLSTSHVIFFALCSLGMFLAAVYHLAPICRSLWPFVIIPFVIYPYTKRFTWLSHFVLGFCLGLAPVGAWIAVTNTLSSEPLLIGGAVLLWVSGFDIFYAIQDIDFDRRTRLFSVPARFGIERSLLVTKILHTASMGIFIWLGIRLGLGGWYYAGVATTSAMLIYENSIIRPNDLSRLNLAFFTLNSLVSLLLFFFVAVEIIYGRGGLG